MCFSNAIHRKIIKHMYTTGKVLGTLGVTSCIVITQSINYKNQYKKYIVLQSPHPALLIQQPCENSFKGKVTCKDNKCLCPMLYQNQIIPLK